MQIKHHDINDWLDIPQIEKLYKAAYVCELTLKTKEGDWANIPVSIFYQENPPKDSSNYFGVFLQKFVSYGEPRITIANAGLVDGLEICAAVSKDKSECIYSAYRHDFQELSDGTFMDGGRDYTRTNTADIVILKIENGKLGVKSS